MSFSSNVKTEICKNQISAKCCAVSECYGILLTCNTFSSSLVRIVTEHAAFAARLPKLFKKAFGITFDSLPPENGDKGKFVFFIQSPEKMHAIFSTFDLDAKRNPALHLNRGIVEENCDAVSFVRGAFLGGGSVTDPEKRYHLEFTTTHASVCKELYSLLLDLGFSPKDTSRNGTGILYFKQSEQIEDMLTLMDAPVSAMALMEARLEKDMRNKINRRCNCEDANSSKTADAAMEQKRAIETLKKRGEFEKLSEALQETARARTENMEASLAELAEILQVSKSAVNHRIRKLMELAK